MMMVQDDRVTLRFCFQELTLGYYAFCNYAELKAKSRKLSRGSVLSPDFPPDTAKHGHSTCCRPVKSQKQVGSLGYWLVQYRIVVGGRRRHSSSVSVSGLRRLAGLSPLGAYHLGSFRDFEAIDILSSVS